MPILYACWSSILAVGVPSAVLSWGAFAHLLQAYGYARKLQVGIGWRMPATMASIWSSPSQRGAQVCARHDQRREILSGDVGPVPAHQRQPAFGRGLQLAEIGLVTRGPKLAQRVVVARQQTRIATDLPLGAHPPQPGL